MKKKIAVIITGGTIGSSAENGIISPNGTCGEGIKKLCEEYEQGFEFEFNYAAQLLSENIGLDELTLIFGEIFRAKSGGFDGIILTHGTDTLAFSAPMAAYAAAGGECALVLVSADKPLENPESNGSDNFRSAMAIFESGIKRGAYVTWRNREGKNEVHLASRVMQADCYTDDIRSFGGEIFAEVKSGKLRFNPNMPTLPETEFELKNPPVFTRNILTVSPCPCIDYSFFNLTNPPAAVLHGLYHSATACVSGNETSAARFIEKCACQNIKVWLSSFKSLDGDVYATSKTLLDAGGVPLINICFEAAFAKLLLAHNQNEFPPEKLMEMNLAGEILP